MEAFNGMMDALAMPVILTILTFRVSIMKAPKEVIKHL
jgi:hypothetical protein